MVFPSGGFGDFGGFDLAALQALQLQQNQPTTVQTSLADVSLGGPTGLSGESFSNIDALIKARTDPALRLVGEGSAEAVRLSELGLGEVTGALEQFGGLEAFEEQQALLGVSGAGAQEAAISGIPVSEFDRELQRRQQQSLLRQAGAAGEVGGGATLQAAQQLAGGQQADIIQKRLAQLEPLVATARGIRTTLSASEEAARARQAQILSGRGVQEANIRFGVSAPVIESTLQQAELSGLRGIAAANQQAGLQGQLAGIAGKFFTQPDTSTINPTQFFGATPDIGPTGFSTSLFQPQTVSSQPALGSGGFNTALLGG